MTALDEESPSFSQGQASSLFLSCVGRYAFWERNIARLPSLMVLNLILIAVLWLIWRWRRRLLRVESERMKGEFGCEPQWPGSKNVENRSTGFSAVSSPSDWIPEQRPDFYASSSCANPPGAIKLSGSQPRWPPGQHNRTLYVSSPGSPKVGSEVDVLFSSLPPPARKLANDQATHGDKPDSREHYSKLYQDPFSVLEVSEQGLIIQRGARQRRVKIFNAFVPQQDNIMGD